MIRLCAFLAVLIAAPLSAQTVRPWTEAVVSVADFAPFEALLRDMGDWELQHQGYLDRSELNYWGLHMDASAEERLYCAPGTQTGCIRFVQFDAVEQEPIRPAARPWDTGGIFSLMVRSDNVDGLYEAALNQGWWAESPPIRFQFGSSDLKNVVITGPHGIHIAAYERISPEFTDFPVGLISQAFNSMRMVRNRPVARDFYRSLGFSILFDSDAEALEPAWSNLSIPRNFTPIIRRSAAALQPQPGETGRVEVMQIVGFEGRDHSARAMPPNLGILSVRYPVEDLAAYRAELEAAGIPIIFAANDIALADRGPTDMIAVRSPDGALTEFYEVN